MVPSPRHADVLMVTGTVNALTKDRLKRVYEQLPEPKHVIAIGACAVPVAYSRAATMSAKD